MRGDISNVPNVSSPSNESFYQKLWAYIFLILAILTEVIGSSFLKIAKELGINDYGFLITAFFICVSYYFVGLAVKRISVGVAFALWEVLGVICIVFIGIFYFNERLSFVQFVGIMLGIFGIILINIGETSQTHKEPSEHRVDNNAKKVD